MTSVIANHRKFRAAIIGKCYELPTFATKSKTNIKNFLETQVKPLQPANTLVKYLKEDTSGSLFAFNDQTSIEDIHNGIDGILRSNLTYVRYTYDDLGVEITQVVRVAYDLVLRRELLLLKAFLTSTPRILWAQGGIGESKLFSIGKKSVVAGNPANQRWSVYFNVGIL